MSDFKGRGPGRPPSTTHGEVASIALRLSAAARSFRYHASKNDVVWGDFEWVLDRLRAALDATEPDEPVIEALARAVAGSNRYEADQLPELRIRLTLISTVSALQAHAMLRYEVRRRVVAEFVALPRR